MPEDIDYLICRNCESPCYVFELDGKEQVASAYCQICGGDDPKDFRLPDEDDADADS
ncbi:MAG TPA: hypothetical protein VF580_09560 [Thermoanaerobaculia bacterium]